MRTTTFALIAVALAAAPSLVEAQQPTRRPARRQPTIEIRGQVPTPQVVTVRPREVPSYSRRILSPNFYDRNFWPSILPAYQVVPRRAITGRVPVDSMVRGDSASSAVGAPAVPGAVVTPRTDSTATPPGTPPARTR
jgi:hypothetical protein